MKQRLGHGSVNYHKNREKWQRLSCRWRWALVCRCVRGWGVIQNKTYLMAPPTFFNPSTVYSTPSPILEPAFRTALPMLAAEKVCWSMLMLRPLSSPNFGQPSWLMMLRSNGSTLYEANLLRSWKTQAQVEIRHRWQTTQKRLGESVQRKREATNEAKEVPCNYKALRCWLSLIITERGWKPKTRSVVPAVAVWRLGKSSRWLG